MQTNPWHHAAVLYEVVTSETTTYTSMSKMTRESALSISDPCFPYFASSNLTTGGVTVLCP